MHPLPYSMELTSGLSVLERTHCPLLRYAQCVCSAPIEGTACRMRLLTGCAAELQVAPERHSAASSILRACPVLTVTSCNAGDSSASAALYLHVGLQNGVLLRTEVDHITGRLSEQRMRFLGTSAPTLLPVQASGVPAMMALSSSPWLGHVYHGKFQLVPLAYDPVDYVAPFCSEKVRFYTPAETEGC